TGQQPKCDYDQPIIHAGLTQFELAGEIKNYKIVSARRNRKSTCFRRENRPTVRAFANMKSTALSALGRRTEEPPISWLMSLPLTQPELISLAAGFTDNESLPVAETGALLREILGSSKSGRVALQYGTTVGDSALRRLTAERLQQLDRAEGQPQAYAAGRTIITSGSQQLLYVVTETLCDPGDIVLVEDPTYFV